MELGVVVGVEAGVVAGWDGAAEEAGVGVEAVVEEAEEEMIPVTTRQRRMRSPTTMSIYPTKVLTRT